ncbi:MAG: hypothetical protein R3309_01865, partial [Reinekea sp.]|nr:hypothetical protein [Reinekea sp.]
EKDHNARSLRTKGRSGVSLGPDGRFFMQPNAFFGAGERQNSGREDSNSPLAGYFFGGILADLPGWVVMFVE